MDDSLQQPPVPASKDEAQISDLASEFYDRLRTRIKTSREENRMSQERLARDASLSGPAIANYESGARKPSLYHLSLIAWALGKPIGYFFGYTGDYPPPPVRQGLKMLIERVTEAKYLDLMSPETPRDRLDHRCVPFPPEIAGDEGLYHRYVDPKTGLATYYVVTLRDADRRAKPDDMVLACDPTGKKPYYPIRLKDLKDSGRPDVVIGIITAELRRLRK